MIYLTASIKKIYYEDGECRFLDGYFSIFDPLISPQRRILIRPAWGHSHGLLTPTDTEYCSDYLQLYFVLPSNNSFRNLQIQIEEGKYNWYYLFTEDLRIRNKTNFLVFSLSFSDFLNTFFNTTFNFIYMTQRYVQSLLELEGRRWQKKYGISILWSFYLHI